MAEELQVQKSYDLYSWGFKCLNTFGSQAQVPSFKPLVHNIMMLYESPFFKGG